MESLQSPADVPKAIVEVAQGALRFIGERLQGGGWSPPEEPPKANITYIEGE